MFDFKTYIMKQFTKFKVIESNYGKVTLEIPKSLNISEEFREYDEFVARGVKILDGVTDVNFNYDLGTIGLIYDADKVNEEKILKWINKVIEVVIKNLKLIEDHGENNLDYVISTLEENLKKEVKVI